MAVVQTLIGNVKGPQGETGATGATGAKGDAATITVGSVSTTAYGNAARVENVGTENDAILNFTIPQGAPGQRTTTMSGLTLDTVTTSAEEFPVPAVGENGATVWGKVIKWFADGLAAIRSKLDANKVVNSQTVTEAGYALDAQQANPNVSGSLAAQISGLNDSLTNFERYEYTNLSSSTATYAQSGWVVGKRGALVMLTINGFKNLPSGSTTVVLNIPEQYRPAFTVYFKCHDTSGDNLVWGYVSTNGDVNARPANASTNVVNCVETISWLTRN